ncbi:MAG: LpqN/LpqT family lipoprotein [Candidatus Sericytochromatia bacterium]
MSDEAKGWLAILGASAAGIAGTIFFTGPSAAAEPMPPPAPSPVTITQTVTVAPGAPMAAPQAVTAPNLAAPAATAGVPGRAPVGSAPSAPLVPQSGVAPTALTVPTLAPATSGTITDYFKSRNVALEPQRAEGFQAFNITLPMPSGWTQVPDPNVPDAFAVIADRNSADLYTPNAQLVVYKLVGNFDPKEAITHGFVDSQSLPAWQTTDASLTDFNGFPSAVIEGTYRQNDMTLNTSRRHVVVSAGPDRYLVSLAVTSMATSQGASSAADATDAIVNGFRVGTATPAAPAPAAVPTPALPTPPLPAPAVPAPIPLTPQSR